MFSLPVVLIRSGQAPIFINGSLHKLAPELCGPQRTQHYALQISDGWKQDTFGNDQYKVTSDRGDSYLFVGLRLDDNNNKKTRFGKGIQGFTKADIEEYAKTVLVRENSFHLAAKKTIESVVHDMRQLSSAIHYQAQDALTFLDDKSKVREYLKSILASQTMLKLRTDVLDLSGEVVATETRDEVAVFMKLTKVKRCFEPIAEGRNIIIDLIGPSFSSSFGPDVLEVVFYIILDNAVKYSPPEGKISIVASEDDHFVRVFVSSLGPGLEKDEEVKIFEKGYRSKDAINSGITGTGMGLHLAKSLVSTFSGEIFLKSSKRSNKSGLSEILVGVSFPISQKDYAKAILQRKKQNIKRRRNRRNTQKH